MTNINKCLFMLPAIIMFMLVSCENKDKKATIDRKYRWHDIVAEVKEGKAFITFEQGALSTVVSVPFKSDSIYEIKSLEGVAKNVYIGDRGGDPDPILCILLEDSTVQTLEIPRACQEKNLTASAKLPELKRIVKFGTRLVEDENFTSYYTYAIDRDGKEYSIDDLTDGNYFYFLSVETKNILEVIKAGDYTNLAKYIHPTKGVHFFPYVEDFESADSKLLDEKINLSASDLVAATQKGNLFVWGKYAGSGEEISLNLKDYFRKFVYDRDYLNGTHLQNGWVFDCPSNDRGKRVSYGFEPSSEEALDWSTLDLILESYNEKWYLTAFVHGCWTP